MSEEVPDEFEQELIDQSAEREQLVGRLMRGEADHVAAMKVLLDVYSRLWSQRPSDALDEGLGPELLDYLVHCIGTYLRGEAKTLDHAFGLKRPRHRLPTADARERGLKLAREVVRLQGKAPLTDGRRDGLFTQVAEKFGASESLVRSSFYKYEEEARRPDYVQELTERFVRRLEAARGDSK